MPLLWINQESVSKEARDEWAEAQPEDIDFEAGFPTTCSPDGSKIFRGGECVAADADASSLPEYKPEEDDPTKVGSCFDAEACFAKPTNLTWKADDCSVDTGTADVNFLNLALVTSDGAGIELKGPPATFVVPLDQDASKLEGYYIDKQRVFLSKVVCNALKSGLATGIVGNGACNAKTASASVCGPWNPAASRKGPEPGRSPELPGVVPAQADIGDAIITGEPAIQDLAVVGQNLYFLRMGDGVGFTDRIVVALKSGGPSLTPVTASQTWPSDTGYRLRGLTFPPSGHWTGQSGVLVTNEQKGLTYVVTGSGPQAKVEVLPVGSFQPAAGDVSPSGEVVLVGRDQNTGKALSFNSPAPPVSSPIPTFAPGTLSLKPDKTGYLVGSRGESVIMRQCSLDFNNNCTPLAGLAANTPDASIADMVVDGTEVWALVTRRSGSVESGYEGLYRMTTAGGELKAVLTRTSDPTLHFHAADGSGSNRLVANAKHVYFTSDALGPDTASIRVVERSTSIAATFVSGFAIVKGLSLDESDVFYGGQGYLDVSATLGNIYRKTQKK